MKKLLSSFLALLLLVSGCHNPEIQVELPEVVVESVKNPLLEVHFLDVGQADCALLISGEETMLIDGGNANDSSLVYSYLNDFGIEHLDYIIGTHAHEDHMGGLSGALTKATVGKIFVPKIGSDAKFYKSFMEKAIERAIEIEIPDQKKNFTFGNCNVTLLNPGSETEEEINNTSLITRVTCDENTFLFTGDAEKSEEETILGWRTSMGATVLKAPHHGSDSSSSIPFMEAVRPQIVVISVGKDNPYGHPHEKILNRYDEFGAYVFRTDVSGHIVMKSDGENIEVETEKRGK